MEDLSILYTATYKKDLFSVSTDQQEKFCQKVTGTKIIKHFKDENISLGCKLFERDGFKKVMKELESGKYKNLIVYNSHVLGINVRKIYKCIDRLHDIKVTLFYASVNVANLGLTPELVHGIVNHVESTTCKIMATYYHISTGKKDNTSTLEYRGNFTDINNILNDPSVESDNYFQLMNFGTMSKYYIYESLTTLKDDKTKIIQDLSTLICEET